MERFSLSLLRIYVSTARVAPLLIDRTAFPLSSKQTRETYAFSNLEPRSLLVCKKVAQRCSQLPFWAWVSSFQMRMPPKNKGATGVTISLLAYRDIVAVEKNTFCVWGSQ